MSQQAKMWGRTGLLLAIVGFGTACAASGEASGGTGPGAPKAAADTCGAASMQSLVGRSETVLHTMKFAPNVRIEPYGQPITMDVRADRVRIIINKDGIIERVVCG